MGYTVYYYWPEPTETEATEYMTPMEFQNVIAAAKQFAPKYNCEVEVHAGNVIIHGECESFAVYASSKDLRKHKGNFVQVLSHGDKNYIFDFCKTKGYEYDSMIKTILVYLLSIGAIRCLSHDGDLNMEIAEDVDPDMFRSLSKKEYNRAMGEAILKTCEFDDE